MAIFNEIGDFLKLRNPKASQITAPKPEFKMELDRTQIDGLWKPSLSINSGHTSDSLARTHQGPWGVLRFLAALRSLHHTSLPDEPCHCDQSSACRVYVGFSDSAWRPERMPQNHSKSRRKDEKKNETWGYCLSYSLTNLDAEMLSRYMWVSKTASKLLSFPPNRPVRRCGEIHCQIHSYFAANMDILTSWILHILLLGRPRELPDL